MTYKGVIVIVGASSGLGKAIAEHYACQGWKTGICARREDKLKEIAEKYPDNIFWRQIDVADNNAADNLLKFIEELGGMDIMVYAAGCGWNNPMLESAKDTATLLTNVTGFTNIVNTAFNYFAENTTPSGEKGQICAITSIAGTKGIGISATYSATKKYQNTYLEALANLAKTRDINIDITDIRPGFIDTALLDTSAHSYPMLMPVTYASKRIIRAIERRKKTAYIDWRWHLVVCVWRMIPRWLWIKLKIKI